MNQKNGLQRRRVPQQKRSAQRISEILDTTARLLARVGLDDLTTVLIAREMGISVGSVYHYFPDKFAILYTLGERWLEEMSSVIRSLEEWDLDELRTEGFATRYCDEMVAVYRQQTAVLPLVQSMFAVPELHELDEQHDELIINGLIKAFRRLGFSQPEDELNRIGRFVLEMTHALFLVIVNQNRQRGAATLAELKSLLADYLHEKYQGCAGS